MNLYDQLKKGDKLTLISMGGMMSCSVATKLVVRDVEKALDRDGNRVTAVAEPRKKSMMALEAMMRRAPGALLLRGHDCILTTQSELPPIPMEHGGSCHSFMIDGNLHLGWLKGKVDESTLEEVATHARAKALACSFQHWKFKTTLHGADGKTQVSVPHEWWARLLDAVPVIEMPPEPVRYGPNPIPPEMMDQLVEAEKRYQEMEARGEVDHDRKPICKLFRAGMTWLVYSAEDDRDTLWVVADIGQDCVEYGTLSLKEARQMMPAPSMVPPLERDFHFDPSRMVYTIADLMRLDRMPSNLYQK